MLRLVEVSVISSEFLHEVIRLEDVAKDDLPVHYIVWNRQVIFGYA